MNELIPQKLNTLDEVSNTLLVLQRNASECVKEVISAQLHLIQLIQIPSLIDNAMDTLVLHLKLALENTSTEVEKMNVRTNFSLIVQELKMYLDLKAQYDIDQWRNAGSDLLDSTVKLMVNVTNRIFSFARNTAAAALDAVAGAAQIAGGADPFPIVGNLASDIRNNLIRQGPDIPTGFLKNLRRWFVAGGKIKEIEQKRKAILIDMTEKLVKYRKIIGPSIVIAGIVDQGITEIRKVIEANYPEKYSDLVFNGGICVGIGAAGAYVVSLIVSLFRLWLESDKLDGWFGRQMLFTLLPAFVVAIVFSFLANHELIEALIKKRRVMKALRKLEEDSKYFNVVE